MRIEKVRVEGFRLLEDLEIMLEAGATVIVGRNNSGKTSLADVFERFSSDESPSIRLQDFSAGIRSRFVEAWKMRDANSAPEEVLATLPKIAITLTFRYDQAQPDLGPLSPFVIDLDTDSSSAIVRVEYAPSLASLDGLLDLSEVKGEDAGTEKEAARLLRALRETLPRAYARRVYAIDPTDPTNRREFEGASALVALMQCNLVRAQRTLDHSGRGDAVVIGKTLSALYKTATTETAAEADRALATQIKAAVESIEGEVQANFDTVLARLIPALQVFGFPSLNDTELRPETSLNVEALLTDHTKIVYAGADGVHLPEHYNGLGTRNLIYMLLQLESFHKAYRARTVRPCTHLIFIEEPEAHLHPQMQEVFIRQLMEAVLTLSKNYEGEEPWPVQFIISSHSSHVANAADFDAIRYLLNDASVTPQARRSKVKDFKKHSLAIPAEDSKFLQQYMTLTKCDLYFADKAIMVEGPTERILMPRLCELVDEEIAPENRLARQYITTVEAGGAYSHLFYPLLDFLELKTLVITDLDSVKKEVRTKDGKSKTLWVKCPVAEGEKTSNAAIKQWFAPRKKAGGGDVAEQHDGLVTEQVEPEPPTLQKLIEMSDGDKVQGFRRITYQVPESEKDPTCARSYEDAFVLANLELFQLPGEADVAHEAWELAGTFPKTETALRYAIEETNWKVPRYIREGLQWLSDPPPPPIMAPPIDGSTPPTEGNGESEKSAANQ